MSTSNTQSPSIRIKNAQYLTDDNLHNNNIELKDGQINIYNGDHFDQENKLLLPGLIDLSVRTKQLSAEQAAAKKSGITQYCLQPNSNKPILDNAIVVQAMQQKIDLYAPSALMLGAVTQDLTGTKLTEMTALKQNGCIALTDAGQPWYSNQTLKLAMKYAQSIGIALHLTAQDISLTNDGCSHAGVIASQLGLPGIPSSSESGALAMMLELIEETGAKVHFCRLSTKRSVQLIQRAKEYGLPVSADVSIHNLILDETAVRGYNTLCHVQPPLRSHTDRLALITGVNTGILDAITSHHQPCTEDDKLTPFPSSKPGIAALELLLPLTLTLCQQGELQLRAALNALTSGPAKVLNIKNKGFILCDTEQKFVVDSKKMLSSDQNCPYHNWELNGIITTI